MIRAALHLDAGPYASYGLNPTPQSQIGSDRVGMKGETSHPTSNTEHIFLDSNYNYNIGNFHFPTVLMF